MTVESEINSEILSFSKELYPWQRDTLRRLIKSGTLTGQDKAEIFERASSDHKVVATASNPPDIVLGEGELPSKGPASRVYLVSVRDLENVNAVKNGTRLSFCKGLTVVFGENASGKSGYARVLKKACTARAVEPILPNVYDKDAMPSPAKAIFEINKDDEGNVGESDPTPTQEKWKDGGPLIGLLRRFAVFDAKCGRAYVSESNKLSYLPWEFDVLNKLAIATKEIKDEFAMRAKNLLPNADALAGFIDSTSIGKLLGSLSAKTDRALIESNAKWCEQDEADLKVKEQKLFTLKANSPAAVRQTLIAERNRIESAKKRLKTVEDTVNAEKVADLESRVTEYGKYDQAVKAAAAMAFGDTELKGVGGDAWRELVLAAAKFSTQQAYPGLLFPPEVEGARCLLCLQPLSDPAKKRLKRFWEFLHDEASSKRDSAKDAMDKAIRTISDLVRALPETTQAIQESLGSSQPSLLATAQGFLAGVTERAKSLEQAALSAKWDKVSAMSSPASTECENAIAAISSEISKVKDDAEANKQITALSNDVEELKARKRLSANLDTVLGNLESLKNSKLHASAADSISTLSITNKTKDLQKRFVTEAFTAAFQTEVISLGIRRAKPGIAEHSERGKVLHEVVLDAAMNQVTPAEVLSEGENTAVSLAYFLSDLGGSEETCGIILDDPLTSVDHRVRERVITRLVLEAKKRQVVVFTHDLAVYAEFEQAARSSNVEFKGQQVEALGQHVGIASEDEPWDVLDVGRRIEKLQGLTASATAAEQAGNTQAYREVVSEFYGKLRSTWERSVEELVFNKVIQRYDRAVKTQSLTGVAADEETITAVFEGMTKTSELIEAHDHAVGAHKPLPSSDEIRADLQRFMDFYQKQKAKRKEAEKKLSHLKN